MVVWAKNELDLVLCNISEKTKYYDHDIILLFIFNMKTIFFKFDTITTRPLCIFL